MQDPGVVLVAVVVQDEPRAELGRVKQLRELVEAAGRVIFFPEVGVVPGAAVFSYRIRQREQREARDVAGFGENWNQPRREGAEPVESAL